MKTYTIKKGNHYCEPTLFGLPLHFGFSKTNVKYKVRFHDDCIYDDNIVIPGWNKLPGWSSIGIHSNSIRLGWIVRSGVLSIGYYCYIKGVRYSGDLMIVQPGVWYEVECSVIHGDYCMRINDNFKLISGGSTPFIAFKAFYYFGGQSTAQNTMSIDIENI